jgi:Spy/CpxP family protein refolding chaperone
MKKNHFKLLFLLVGMTLIGGVAFKANAQACQQGPGCKPGFYNLPGITDDQTKKMDEVRMKHMKQLIPIQKQIEEKKAHINTLMVAEKPDIGAINTTIDEMANLKGQLLKLKAQCKQDIRAILTDNQRVMFDAKMDLFGKGCCGDKGKMEQQCKHEEHGKNCSGPKGPGFGPGQGPGPGPNPNCPKSDKK